MLVTFEMELDTLDPVLNITEYTNIHRILNRQVPSLLKYNTLHKAFINLNVASNENSPAMQ